MPAVEAAANGLGGVLVLNEARKFAEEREREGERSNVIPFPDRSIPPPTDMDKDKVCYRDGGGGERDCVSTGLAGVAFSGRYGQTIMCQYRCPRKGIRYLTRTIPFRSMNPMFLCPATRPERAFF